MGHSKQSLVGEETGQDLPTVVLLVLDTARADTVYSNLGSETLPTLARIANEGVKFKNAISTAP